MSFVRTHFCVVVAFGTAGGGTCGKAVAVSCLGARGGSAATRACPRKIGLNCSMPAMVSSTVGSSGTSDELGKMV